MSRSGGIIARIWHGLQKSLTRESQVVKMVGEDHLGNKYFEKLAGQSLASSFDVWPDRLRTIEQQIIYVNVEQKRR